MAVRPRLHHAQSQNTMPHNVPGSFPGCFPFKHKLEGEKDCSKTFFNLAYVKCFEVLGNHTSDLKTSGFHSQMLLKMSLEKQLVTHKTEPTLSEESKMFML